MNAYTNHVDSIKVKVLDAGYPVIKMLEFGCGDGSVMYTDLGINLTSVEVVVPGNDRGWFDKTSVRLDGRGWEGHYIEISEEAAAVEHHIRETFSACKRPWGADFDHPVIESMAESIKPFMDQEWDLVLVDAALHLRAELAHLMWPSTKILAIHDANCAPSMYGWHLINGRFKHESKLEIRHNATCIWIRE